MPSPPAPLAGPGDIVCIPDGDYLYGAGAVTVRVAGIDPGLDRFPGLEWIRILAVNLGKPDGTPYPMIVRATALRRAPVAASPAAGAGG
ncbi:hypothetical protein [Plantactinospora sp. B5E13]|uniref:hypothetical protein n=1 Tax=Plantactinospora sp. B5E13 TaxID=3153758 RepID=UPI00325D7500